MTEQTVVERNEVVEHNQELENMASSSATSTADLARDAAGNGQKTESQRPDSLFSGNEGRDFRKRWEQIQTGFVDEPRGAVQQADQLVATAIHRLAEIFADERNRLEHEWDKGDNVSTEDLRQALRKYRSFFDRLLSV